MSMPKSSVIAVLLPCGRSVEVLLTRKRIKTLRLRVTADGTVAASAPYAVSVAAVERFIASHEKWLLKNLERKQEPKAYPEVIADGSTIVLLGEPYTIKLQSGKKDTRLCSGELVLSAGASAGQSALQKQLDDFLRARAAEYFTECARRYFVPFAAPGKAFPPISIVKMKTRWGSCSCTAGTIRFSLYLYAAPAECCEYVVAHELCHLVYAGHQSDFYALLARIMPDWKQRRARLKALSASLVP